MVTCSLPSVSFYQKKLSCRFYGTLCPSSYNHFKTIPAIVGFTPNDNGDKVTSHHGGVVSIQ